MTLARLLASTVVLYSLTAFSQNQVKLDLLITPGKIVSNRPVDFGSGQISRYQLPVDRLEVDSIRYFTGKGGPFSNLHSCGQLSDADATCHMVRAYFMSLLPNGQTASIGYPSNESDADATCFTIRTYVVARDSKDSDSTHPAGYSTCQPSAQYQLKTTVLRSGLQDK
jgi:hypothetical protein